MYDIAVYILGDLPLHMQYLYSIFAFILSVIFFFVVISPFILIFKKCSRW